MEDHKKFISYLAKLTKLQPELLERDFLLHLLLLKLKENNFLNEYLFKGGSCLIKCYLGYYRFSVDLDFTYKHQKLFARKSQKQIRKILSKEINRIMNVFENIAKEIGLKFKAEKKKKYVEFGGGNKMTTFKLYYNSILNIEEFIKIQINFIEKILFKTKKLKVKSLCPKDEKLSFLFPSLYKIYSKNFILEGYDIKEILCEKIRAILTRKGFKERDFIDVYLIIKNFHIFLQDFERQIVEKLKFVLELYDKYRQNLREVTKIIKDLRITREEFLLIKPIDSSFGEFLKEFKKFLLKIVNTQHLM